MGDRILIIDNKPHHEDFNSAGAIARLSVLQKSIIDFFPSGEGLWKELVQNDDVQLLFAPSKYSYIFLHDGLPLKQQGLMPVLIHKLSQKSKVVLVSGSHRESSSPVLVKLDPTIAPDTEVHEILRRQYYFNLANFVESYFVFGDFRIDFLYDSYKNPKQDLARTLLSTLIGRLELSTSAALNDPALDALLALYGYSNAAEIKQKLQNKSQEEIKRNLKELVERK